MSGIAAGTPWSTALLELVGAPLTPANYQFVNAWAIREHGSITTLFANNPFFTTAGGAGTVGVVKSGTFPLIPGSAFPGGKNTAGVPSYPDMTTGVTVTAYHMNREYPGIVAALKSGNPASFASNSQFQSDLTRWSGSGYSGVQGIAAPSGPVGPSLNRPTSTDAATTPIDPHANDGGSSIPPVVKGPADAVIGTVDGVLSVGKFLGRLTDPSYLLRGLQILGGAGLVGTGLVLLARQVALAADLPDPVKVATRSSSRSSSSSG